MEKLKIGIVRTWDPLKNCGDLYARALKLLLSMGDTEVVEASLEIGSAMDAQEVCQAFSDAGVDLTIIMCCRLAGDGRIVEPFMHSGQELAIWCLPEPSRTGPLLLNSMTCANLYMSAAHQMAAECGGKQAKWLYGTPEDSLMAERLSVAVDALRAAKQLRSAVLVHIGQTAAGFTNLCYDPEKIATRFGVKIVEYSLDEIFRDIAQADDAAAKALAAELPVGARCCEAKAEELELTARLILVMRELKE